MRPSKFRRRWMLRYDRVRAWFYNARQIVREAIVRDGRHKRVLVLSWCPDCEWYDCPQCKRGGWRPSASDLCSVCRGVYTAEEYDQFLPAPEEPTP